MTHKRKLNNYFVNVARQENDSVADNFTYRQSVRSQGHADTRIRLAKMKAQRDIWKGKLDDIIDQGEEAFTALVNDLKTEGEIRPYHFALICLAPKKYLTVWLNHLVEEVLPSLKEREQMFLILKTVIVFEQHMTKAQIKKMLDLVYKSITPPAAVLINYYFPAYVKTNLEKEINALIFEACDRGRTVEAIVADFEKRTKDFFIELSKLMT